MNKSAFRAAMLASTVALAVLAGCSDDMSSMNHSPTSTTPAPSSSGTSTAVIFNEADVTFAQMMVPHHQQAVAMSETLLNKPGLNVDVQALATEIKEAQQPEIDTMRSWLNAWGQPLDGMPGMDHGDDGMATEAQMQTLEEANATTAQRLYVEMMIKHHEGAIRMAQDEVAGGKNIDAVRLAQRIDTAQQAEVATMRKLLTDL